VTKVCIVFNEKVAESKTACQPQVLMHRALASLERIATNYPMLLLLLLHPTVWS
jgi:hypothetical protein